MLSKEEFIEQFAIAFMASYAANVYQDCCMKGDFDRVHNPQIEDAYFIAEKVWVNKQESIN
jgi:hypothetical protein